MAWLLDKYIHECIKFLLISKNQPAIRNSNCF